MSKKATATRIADPELALDHVLVQLAARPGDTTLEAQRDALEAELAQREIERRRAARVATATQAANTAEGKRAEIERLHSDLAEAEKDFAGLKAALLELFKAVLALVPLNDEVSKMRAKLKDTAWRVMTTALAGPQNSKLRLQSAGTLSLLQGADASRAISAALHAALGGKCGAVLDHRVQLPDLGEATDPSLSLDSTASRVLQDLEILVERRERELAGKLPEEVPFAEQP